MTKDILGSTWSESRLWTGPTAEEILAKLEQLCAEFPPLELDLLRRFLGREPEPDHDYLVVMGSACWEEFRRAMGLREGAAFTIGHLTVRGSQYVPADRMYTMDDTPLKGRVWPR